MDITSKDIEKFRKENPEKSLFLTDEKCIKLLKGEEDTIVDAIFEESTIKIKIKKQRKLKVGDKVKIKDLKEYKYKDWDLSSRIKQLKKDKIRIVRNIYFNGGIMLKDLIMEFRSSWLELVEDKKVIKEKVIKQENLKVGDKVKVIRPFDLSLAPDWIYDMDIAVNKICKIKDIYMEDNKKLGYMLVGRGLIGVAKNCYYRGEWLELIESKELLEEF